MKSDLTIITVACQDNGFTENMIQSVHRFTHPIPNIIICDNGRNANFPKQWMKYPNVKIVKNTRAHKYKKNKTFFNTSMQHGVGLNLVFKHVKTKRTAIIEPDCAVLKKGWDEIPDGYEMRTCEKGVGMNNEHYYFPCFMVFKTDCMYRHGSIIDFKPEHGKSKNGIVISVANKINRYADVGWKIYEKIPHEKVDLLENVRWDKARAKAFNKEFTHKTNVFIDSKQNIVGTHFWRGNELARRGDNAAVQKNMWMGTVKLVVDGYG